MAESDRSDGKGRRGRGRKTHSTDGDDDRSLLICFSVRSHGRTNNWIFVAHRPISADTTHCVNQDGAANHSCCPGLL